MIQSLQIQNFQSHKDSTLVFSPGVNVILGVTDSGKTSIIRALKWLKDNRPIGDEFRSRWGGETNIVITLDDKTKLFRRKGKENIYAIGKTAQDHKELKAFGKDVPEEIQAALNMDEINLQQQFDSHFLISSSPGEVAAHFNQVAHLKQIDSSVSYVNSQILILTNKKKADEGTVTKYQAELIQYNYIEKFEIKLEVVEHQVSNHIQLISSRKKLQTQLDLLEENTKEIKEIEVKTKLEKPVNAILKLYKEKKVIEDDRADLLASLITLNGIDISTTTLSKKVKLLPKVESILKLREEYQKLCDNYWRLKDLMTEHQKIVAKQIKTKERLEKKESKFHKHMPDQCPLCGEIKTR